MIFSPLIQELINALRCLPGVGNKTAQRMALHLLERDRDAANHLAITLANAVKLIGRCSNCRILTEEHTCGICSNVTRDQRILCVVETPADVVAIEESGSFRGLYFVLLGHLSPIDGIGPEDIGIDQLLERLRVGGVVELILATNPTVEGEATAHFISQKAKALGVNVSRIAHGVPLGSELEYIDGRTLVHAFQGRKTL